MSIYVLKFSVWRIVFLILMLALMLYGRVYGLLVK